MASKKKLNRKDFIFDGKKNETLIKYPGQINGIDFCVMNLENCEVFLCDYIAQIFIDDCVNCKIYLGPVEGSVFVRSCKNVHVSSASQQLRISDSENIVANIASDSEPALEECKNIEFGPYNFAYPMILTHFQSTKLSLSPARNKWSQVYDFTPNKEQRNWSIQPANSFAQVIKELENYEGEINNPVPLHVMYGGTLEGEIIIGSRESQEDNTDMQSFDITIGQKKAQEIFSKQQTCQDETYEQQEYLKEESNNFDQFNNQIQNNQYQEYQQFDVVQSQNNDPFDDYIQQHQQEFNQEHSFQNNNMNYSQPQFQGLDKQMFKIAEKQNQERLLKEQKRQQAQQEIKQFKEQREIRIRDAKKVNRQTQEALIQAQQNQLQGKGKWDLVCQNIELKDGERKGDKNISRMKDVILNAKQNK